MAQASAGFEPCDLACICSRFGVFRARWLRPEATGNTALHMAELQDEQRMTLAVMKRKLMKMIRERSVALDGEITQLC